MSFAPKASMRTISEWLGGRDRLVRMMNAPSAIGGGYNPFCYGKALSIEERRRLESMFDALGEHPEVDEGKLEAFAILTAMGPTYFFFQYFEIMRIVSEFGLSQGEILAGARAMLDGSFAMVLTPACGRKTRLT